jgi:hypothetical protein
VVLFLPRGLIGLVEQLFSRGGRQSDSKAIAGMKEMA